MLFAFFINGSIPPPPTFLSFLSVILLSEWQIEAVLAGRVVGGGAKTKTAKDVFFLYLFFFHRWAAIK
jgi:hypothetical protein